MYIIMILILAYFSLNCLTSLPFCDTLNASNFSTAHRICHYINIRMVHAGLNILEYIYTYIYWFIVVYTFVHTLLYTHQKLLFLT